MNRDDVDLVVQVTSDRRIHVDGDVDLTVTTRLGSVLHDIVRYGTGTVVVDLSYAGFVSCRAAERLLHCQEELRPSGRRLVLRGAHPALRRSLAICGLDPMLDPPPTSA